MAGWAKERRLGGGAYEENLSFFKKPPHPYQKIDQSRNPKFKP
jgi:hypothetical protein